MRALTAWNTEAFVEALHDKAPDLDWPAVFTCLDTPTLELPSADGVALIMSLHRLACGGPLPVRCLLGRWKNERAQLQAITHLIATAKTASNLDWSAARRVDEAVPSPSKPDLQCWACLDLTATLLRLSARGFYEPIKQLFAEAISGAPQQLLAALVQTAPVGSASETALQAEMLESLLPTLISGGDSAGSQSLLKRMWELQPAAVMRGMAQLHAAQPQSLLRLLDLAQSFNSLEEILRLPSYAFTLDLAVVAQRKDLIALGPWAISQLEATSSSQLGGAHSEPHGFAHALIAYIKEKLLNGAAPGSRVGMGSGSSSSTVNVLSAEYAAVFFRALTASPLPPPLGEEVANLYKACAQAKPKLQTLFNPDAPKPPVGAMGGSTVGVVDSTDDVSDLTDPAGNAAAIAAAAVGGPGDQLVPPASPGLGSSDGAAGIAAGFGAGTGAGGPAPLPGMPGGQDIHFAAGIEEEANSYFQRIYTGSSTIDEVITMLRRFQLSSNPREQQVYACMVHNLFDEYKYFPKYPDKPLKTTALLFGALVQHALVSHITLGMFLRYVLEALRKPPGTKMCKFGATALDSFKQRLPEWPQYCQHLYAIPHLTQVCESELS